jgi:hypothetical protein
MSKQLLKGLSMFMAIMAMALMTAVATANAQSQKSKVNIPFDFVVGDKGLPAGDYAITNVTSNSDTLRIRNATANDSAVRLTTTVNGTADRSKLVFHRYGERYFLAEVWTGAGNEGRMLFVSRQERALQKELARIAVNRSALPYATVEIAVTGN